MRKQYHLRPTPEGLLAWDVARLVTFAKDLTPKKIFLTSIKELDEPFWYQEGGPAPSCRSVGMHARLIDEADLSSPIILDPDGKVMDGMHRVCKALRLGHQSIKAVQLQTLPKPDFVNIPADQLPYED